MFKRRKLTEPWKEICAELFPPNKEDNLTAEELRKILHYDPETGEFVWLVDRLSAGRVLAHAGDRAGYCRADGRYEIGIGGISYFAHRLAFLWVTGDWPAEELDHKNRIKGDNRWCNLREATRTQNLTNRTKYGKSLPRGVQVRGNKFKARFNECYLGLYETAEEASAVREEVAREVYGEFYCEP